MTALFEITTMHHKLVMMSTLQIYKYTIAKASIVVKASKYYQTAAAFLSLVHPPQLSIHPGG